MKNIVWIRTSKLLKKIETNQLKQVDYVFYVVYLLVLVSLFFLIPSGVTLTEKRHSELTVVLSVLVNIAGIFAVVYVQKRILWVSLLNYISILSTRFILFVLVKTAWIVLVVLFYILFSIPDDELFKLQSYYPSLHCELISVVGGFLICNVVLVRDFVKAYKN